MNNYIYSLGSGGDYNDSPSNFEANRVKAKPVQRKGH